MQRFTRILGILERHAPGSNLQKGAAYFPHASTGGGVTFPHFGGSEEKVAIIEAYFFWQCQTKDQIAMDTQESERAQVSPGC